MTRITSIKPRSATAGFLGVLLVAVAALFSLAAPARAETKTPSLAGTFPDSPGTLTTPRVHGVVGEVVSTHSIRLLQDPPRLAGLEGGNGIELYAEPGCAGPVVASGSVSEFENSGIQVEVKPGSTTTFSATNTELGVPSGCSNDIVYRHVSNPPNVPVVAGVNPAAPANNNFPLINGSADAGSAVSVYANSSCSGAPLGSGPASQFSAGGIQVAVTDNSTTTFYAKASWAELPSLCSSTSATYQEVTPVEQPGGGGGGSGGSGGSGGGGTESPPPADPPGKPKPPQLKTSPGGIANNISPFITGSAPGAVTVKIYTNADCKGSAVSKTSVSQLATGIAVTIVPNTTVEFYGKSVDAGGEESACSTVPATYTDDSIAPRTRITAGPGVKTVKRTVVFRFADITGGPETSFLCKVDKKPWKACTAPLRLKHLGHKRHSLRVKAYDAAGNQEKTGVKRSFQVIPHP